jgi:hypothetical protein
MYTMNISEKEAQETLAAVEQMKNQIRKSIASSESSLILMIWGIIWAVAYIATHFCVVYKYQERIGLIWSVLCSVGALITFILCWQQYRTGRPTRTPAAQKEGWRMFWFWLLLFGFMGVWMAILPPQNGIRFNAFMVTVIMFAYIVMGLWSYEMYLFWLGLVVTGSTLIGVFVIPHEYYNLWMTPMAAGPMFGVGFYMLIRWRKVNG